MSLVNGMPWFSTQSPGTMVNHPTDEIHQTFIIVRPPPSKTNHPLNLQVQLVPYVNRNERATRANASRETLADIGETGVPLQRTTSTGSNRSDTESTYSANGSISSVSSGSTISGRRIVPLYNLHAHNVMTNTITDAGTDAKVAKFFKRGLEVMGLAILEPVEVWGHYFWEVVDDDVTEFRRASISAPANADLPTVVEVPSNPASPGSMSTKASEPPAKKLFGRLFKRKEAPNPSLGSAPAQPQPPTINEPSSSVAATTLYSEPYLQPPVLGLQARIKSPAMPPHGRPSTYVWVIRKWIKCSGESWIGGVADSVGGVLGIRDGTERNATEVTDVEVRFEWKKVKARGEESRKRRTGTGASGLEEEDGNARRHSSVFERGDTGSTLGGSVHETPSGSGAALSKGGLLSNHAQKAQNRLSLPGFMPRNKSAQSAPGPLSLAPLTEPVRASSPNPPASIATTNTTAEDDGEESDPEDSETPWTCSLHLRSRPHTNTRAPTASHPAQLSSGPAPAEPRVDVKLKVATLAPAPHHPKVVAQIKTPFPLRDVLVDAGVVRPRTAGLQPSEGDEGVLVLTAEEIKDVVSCTGLWVIVREGYGGLAKKRKGDGWLIRG